MIDKLTGRPVLFFDADKGGAGGGDDADGDTTKGGEGENTDDPAAKQKALDKSYAERAKRAAEAQKKALYESLGVKNDAEFEAYLKEKKEAEDKQKSEAEKLADAAKKAQADLEKSQTEHEQKLAEMRKRVRDTEIKIAASQPVKDKDGKVTRPAFRADAIEDVLLVIESQYGSEIEETDGGKFEGIEKTLAKIAKAKPFYLEAAQTADRSKGTPGAGGRFIKKQPDEPANDDWFKSI